VQPVAAAKRRIGDGDFVDGEIGKAHGGEKRFGGGARVALAALPAHSEQESVPPTIQ
jgi:hypothetical protein